MWRAGALKTLERNGRPPLGVAVGRDRENDLRAAARTGRRVATGPGWGLGRNAVLARGTTKVHGGVPWGGGIGFSEEGVSNSATRLGPGQIRNAKWLPGKNLVLWPDVSVWRQRGAEIPVC